VRQQLGRVLVGSTGATLASGGEESPGTRPWGSAWASCSAPGLWRQPKALLLCEFASQTGVYLEPKPKSFEDACG